MAKKNPQQAVLALGKFSEQKLARRRASTEAALGMPLADWCARKRGEWALVMRALDRFTYGSAYTPASDDLYDIQKAAERLERAMRRDWFP